MSIEQIVNYSCINDAVATSGQPEEHELKWIADADYDGVINLALHDAEYALKDETASVKTLGMDYIVNARAQGITTFRIVCLYALKNAMLPSLALIGLRFGWMLGGTVLIESVFDWPGLGLYTVQAATASDFEPVIASTLILGAWFMLTNFLIDILYGLLDPRILSKA